MASDYGTYRVFISSSMKELEEERKVVEHIVQEEGYQSFVYERDAGARPWNHEETFVGELEASDLYIGIFWNKFGPYTEQEFELAKEWGIPHLVFEKDSQSGARDPQLQTLLDTYNTVTNPDGMTIARFASLEELREKCTRSFKNLLAEFARRYARGVSQGFDRISPQDLPCLCNRDPQEIRLARQVTEYFQVRSTRPLLVILPGRVEERHGYYVNRIKLCSLEEYLVKAGIRGGKKLVEIPYSPCAMQTPADLRSKILSPLKEPDVGNDEVIIDHIQRRRLKALVVVMRILASECEGTLQRPLQLITEYLAGFPDTPEQVLVCAVVCLEEDGKVSTFQQWWRRVLGDRRAGEAPFARSIAAIQEKHQNGHMLRVELLPRLMPPKAADVRRWIGHPLVESSVPYLAEKALEELFEGQKSLSMDELYPKLVELVEKRAE